MLLDYTQNGIHAIFEVTDGGLVICETDREIESVPAGFHMRRHAEYSRTHITVFEKEAE